VGHERTGALPQTLSWRQIVATMEQAASGSDAEIAHLATRTLQQVRDRFEGLHRDPGVQAAFGFLVAVARAEPGPTLESRAAPDPSPLPDATPLRLTVALNDWVDLNAKSREYAELGKRAAAEALTAWHTQQSRQPDLPSTDPRDSSQAAWAAASTGAGFSEITRMFLASFTSRYLRYFLEREASAAIASVVDREQFSERLHRSVDSVSRHAFETARIAQSFAAGWFNKYARDQTPSNARLSGFLKIAFEKLREELRREGLR
jgi:hypothetical protein